MESCGNKKKLFKNLGLDKLGKIASKIFKMTQNKSLNKTFQNLKKKRDEEIAKKLKKRKLNKKKLSNKK